MPFFTSPAPKGSSNMTDRLGQQLGNYRLIRLLGTGGFADVYLGEHVFLKIQAAIKILHTLRQEDMQGFLQEAQTIARLKHPHIVRILEFGVDSIPFLAMEYASNGTLRQRHPKGSIVPLATVVSYVRQVASALQYAHQERLYGLPSSLPSSRSSCLQPPSRSEAASTTLC